MKVVLAGRVAIATAGMAIDAQLARLAREAPSSASDKLAAAIDPFDQMWVR